MRKFVLTMLLLSGCGPFWVDPYISVQESSLNWVAIHYYSLRNVKPGDPIRRIGVTLYGNGLVEVKEGASELVSNDFARRHTDGNWQNIRTHRVNLTPAEARDIFQNLVNFGLLDREKTGRSSGKKEENRFIAVSANLSNNTYSDNVNIFEEDPDLAEQLLDVVREFDNPTR